MLRKLKYVRRQSGREQRDLDVSGQVLEYVLNLVLETTREHLVGLVKSEQLKVVCLHESSLHHVEDTARSAHNNVNTVPESFYVLTNVSSSDASMDFSVTEFAQ